MIPPTPIAAARIALSAAAREADLEMRALYLAIARSNVNAARTDVEQVELLLGPAEAELKRLAAKGAKP